MKLSKKVTLLQEILELAVAISESKTNPAQIFVDYSGHVDGITVYGYTVGNCLTSGNRDIDYLLYLDGSDVIGQLNKIRTRLTKLLAK
jgi:hypothetical protein